MINRAEASEFAFFYNFHAETVSSPKNTIVYNIWKKNVTRPVHDKFTNAPKHGPEMCFGKMVKFAFFSKGQSFVKAEENSHIV